MKDFSLFNKGNIKQLIGLHMMGEYFSDCINNCVSQAASLRCLI